jgi:hypothetical protein
MTFNPKVVYDGSDATLTRAFYAELCSRGSLGKVAMNLFRAQKTSDRAKVYRGGIRGKGSYRSMAYDRKSYSMDELCAILATEAESLKIVYGWKQDPNVVFGENPSYVFYCEIPQGQVSFHSPTRGKGPDYAGEWDGTHLSAERILAFCEAVLAERPESKTA